MISHVTLHVSDIDKSLEFYKKALAPLGYVVSREFPQWKVYGFADPDNSDLWLHGDGAKQTTHIAFTAKSEEEAQAFYKAALAAGAKDNGAPGYRTDYGAGYYAAFVLDPDGHNIEAMYWNSAKGK